MRWHVVAGTPVLSGLLPRLSRLLIYIIRLANGLIVGFLHLGYPTWHLIVIPCQHIKYLENIALHLDIILYIFKNNIMMQIEVYEEFCPILILMHQLVVCRIQVYKPLVINWMSTKWHSYQLAKFLRKQHVTSHADFQRWTLDLIHTDSFGHSLIRTTADYFIR